VCEGVIPDVCFVAGPNSFAEPPHFWWWEDLSGFDSLSLSLRAAGGCGAQRTTVVNDAQRHRVKHEHTETISDFSKQLLFDDYLIQILNLNNQWQIALESPSQIDLDYLNGYRG